MQNPFAIRLSPAVKYWIFLVGIITVIFAVIFGSFAASFIHLSPEEQALVEQLFNKLIPFPFIGSIILVAFICTMVSLLFRYYIIPVLRMAEQTRLITAANPDYRIVPEGAREMVMLADVINESADAFQRLQNEVDEKVYRSGQALKEERNRLAALMSELPYGVVVCNLDGKVMLYNRKALEMLSEEETREDGGAIGLGRSIFGVLEKDPLVHALEVMNHAFEQDQLKPALGLMTKLCGQRFIRVNMAPVTNENDGKRSLSGFVLSLEDITGEINADSDRDKLLQNMIDAVQQSLGKLHQDINALCDAKESDNETCARHQQAIVGVTDDLEEHLALARQLYTEHRSAYGNRENVKAETFLTLIDKNVSERFAMTTTLEAEDGLWLKIDSYAIVQAITTLAGYLKAEYHITEIKLSVIDHGGQFAKFEMHWQKETTPCTAIHDWLDLPLFIDTDGKTDSPGAIIERHNGAIKILENTHNVCHGVKIILPSAMQEESAGVESSIAPRPVSYEFDLFNQPGQEALAKIPLSKLTYVAFDTETTGLNPSEGDEIIQLGAIRIINGRILRDESIDQLVNPQRPVPETSVKVHGIDPALLPSQPVITKVLPNFHRFASDSVLVAHNAAFDMRFLQIKEAETGLKFDNPVLDTLLLSSIVHPNQQGHSLDDIAERFNITIVGRHTAIGDALVTAEILIKLIPLLEAQGIITLEDALQASTRSPFAKIAY